MEFRIDELLDGFEDQSVQIQTVEYTSADRIKELTMKKIKQDYAEGNPRRGARKLFTVMLAAVLVFALTAGAFAAFSIHQKRQQQLREDLKIDENNVTSYVEYVEPQEPIDEGTETETPAIAKDKQETEMTVTLLSAIRDGGFQRVYMNISPVTKEDALEATRRDCFGYSFGNTNQGGLAHIPFDASLITEDDIILLHNEELDIEYETLDSEKRQALQMAYSYDEISQTLMLTCSIAESHLAENEPVVLNILKFSDKNRVESVLGTVSFMPTELEMREVLFDKPVALYNDVLKENCCVVGVQIYPTGVAWMIELNNAEKLFTDGTLTQEEQNALMSWLNCTDIPLSEAALVFEDGSEFKTGTILSSPYENGRVMHRASWQTTINIYEVNSIRIGEETREVKVETLEGWPEADKIRSVISAEQAEVYWLVDEMPMPDQIVCYGITALDIDAFWDTLKEKLPNATGRVESGVLYIFNGADQIETILEALNDATGATFTEVNAVEDDTTIQHCYAQTVDGICLDTEYYTSDGDVIFGTRVTVYENGRVSIQNPLRLNQRTGTLCKKELMRSEEIHGLCETYYQGYGLPCVTVVTGIKLVYYAADGELCPAWQVDETWYPSEKGHITSQMVDGQTGEFLRK